VEEVTEQDHRHQVQQDSEDLGASLDPARMPNDHVLDRLGPGGRRRRDDLVQQRIDLGRHLHDEPPVSGERLAVGRKPGYSRQPLEGRPGLLLRSHAR
jgi:hypothetical protein